MMGATRNWLRRVFNVSWTSVLASPVLIAGRSALGSSAPRTYSLLAHPVPSRETAAAASGPKGSHLRFMALLFSNKRRSRPNVGGRPLGRKPGLRPNALGARSAVGASVLGRAGTTGGRPGRWGGPGGANASGRSGNRGFWWVGRGPPPPLIHWAGPR